MNRVYLLVVLTWCLAHSRKSIARSPNPGLNGVSSSQLVDIERLQWMAGCWQQRTGASVTDEQWMAPRGGTMVGMSRTVVRDRLRAWESLRLVTDSGRVVYIAQPNGGAATRFVATTVTDSMAVFENPQHDFPQRLAYRRVHADSLVARVSGQRGGSERGMDIPFRRVAGS